MATVTYNGPQMLIHHGRDAPDDNDLTRARLTPNGLEVTKASGTPNSGYRFNPGVSVTVVNAIDAAYFIAKAATNPRWTAV